METEPLLGRHALLFGDGVMMVDLGKDLDYVPGLFGEGIYLDDKVSPAVCQAVANNGLRLVGHVPGESVAHLDGVESSDSLCLSKIAQVFTGVFVSCKEAHYRFVFGSILTHDPGCKNAFSLLFVSSSVSRSLFKERTLLVVSS